MMYITIQHFHTHDLADNDLPGVSYAEVQQRLSLPAGVDFVLRHAGQRYVWLQDRPDDPPLVHQLAPAFPKQLPFIGLRADICSGCPQASDNTCGACGCNLLRLQADPDASCPLGKWGVDLS